ncbi:MAG TPA: CotS family spore coat protein [Bacillota bacterium]|nr:CotS family spore coat protein [Bacillota bacterium]
MGNKAGKVDIGRKELAEVGAEYGAKWRKVYPVQNNVFKVVSDRGTWCLKLADLSEAKARYLSAIQQHLAGKGFQKFARLVTTTRGEPYVKIGKNIYLVNEWIEGEQCDFNIISNLEAATRTLAEFHRYSQGFVVPPGARAKVMWNRWPQTFTMRLRELVEFKERALCKPWLTEFDRRFLANVDYFYRMGQAALRTFAFYNYPRVAAMARERGFFTHRDVAARNFVITREGDACLIDFDYSRFDLRVNDLCRLIERSLKKQRWDFDRSEIILDIYQEINPLATEELPILLGFFQFPQKFWRLVDRYYGSKKDWPEREFTAKLNKLIAQKVEKERFIWEFSQRYCNRVCF